MSAITLKKQIERLDPKNVGLSIALLKQQIFSVERSFPKKLRIDSKKIRSVVVCAMGGSGLGSDLLRYLHESYFKVPFIIVNGYDLPGYVDSTTLVIAITYSGTTEEIFSCMRAAIKRKAQCFVICEQGGRIGKEAARKNIPHFMFSTEDNPSKQPRIGIGYTMASAYMLLEKLHLLKPGHEDIFRAARALSNQNSTALSWARATQGQSFIVIGAEHLRGNAHILSNQMNECAKAFAPYYFLPELDHHLLEGLGSLQKAKRHWTAVFLESSLYSTQLKKRFKLTRHVFEKQGFRTRSISFSGSRAEQSLKMLSFGSWFSYYGAILAGKDPSTIPWVDYFKKLLKR